MRGLVLDVTLVTLPALLLAAVTWRVVWPIGARKSGTA